MMDDDRFRTLTTQRLGMRPSRRAVLRLLGGGTLAAGILGQAETRSSTAQTPTSATFAGETFVGLSADGTSGIAMQMAPAAAQTPPAPPDHHVFEFVGKVAQNGADFEISGYVTHLEGADDSALFTETGAAEQTEASARLTFAGTLRTTLAAAVGKQLHALVVAGTLTFYAHEQGGADFTAGLGFDAGTAIATAGVRVQDVVSVYAPQQGLASGAGDLAWQLSSPFTLAGQQLQLGTQGTSLRISFSGVGTLTQPTPPVATIDIAGYGVAE